MGRHTRLICWLCVYQHEGDVTVEHANTGIAQKLQLQTDDVYQAKFAFCALIDEIVLMSKLRIRDEWERNPLQLEMFGEHMAGERFFDHLEKLRGEGARRVQVLEVFHMCLLLGFQGRYILEGIKKLGYLTARLGDEIVHLQGKRAPFAPHWAPPDSVAHKLRIQDKTAIQIIEDVFADYPAAQWRWDVSASRSRAISAAPTTPSRSRSRPPNCT